MLDDAVMKNGRQKKWKYIICLGLLSVLALGGAWTVNRGISLKFFLTRPVDPDKGIWYPKECFAEGQYLTAGETLYTMKENRLYIYEKNGSAPEMRQLPEGTVLRCGAFCIGFVPLAREVYVFNGDAEPVCSVSGGVDAAAVGREHFAVITDCSGCVSRVSIFDADGNTTGNVGFPRAAAVRLAFLGDEDRLAVVFCDTDGLWHLGIYTSLGQEEICLSVAEDVCSDVFAFDDSLVLQGKNYLEFYTGEGRMIRSLSLSSGMVISGFGGSDELMALLARRGNEIFLITISPRGEILGQTELPMEIRDMEVLDSFVYVLDDEKILIYDALCTLKGASPQGARAEALAASEDTLWIPGYGEMMILNS